MHLGPEQDAAHVPRFAAAVHDAIGEVILGEVAVRAEELAQHIAEHVRDRQQAPRAEVTLSARYPERKTAPVSGIATQEIYTLHTSAVASPRGTRRIVGVTAQAMATSPTTQALVAAAAGERLAAAGFAEDRIERILATVPVAAAGDRGFGTLHVGCPEGSEADLDAAALLAIVEEAMSSEIYELLKRSDEGAIVERAHRHPRSPEDCVRGMLGAVLERYGHLPDDAFVSARPGERRHASPARRRRRAPRAARRGARRGRRRRPFAALSARQWLDAAS